MATEEPRPTCLHANCGCPPDGEQAYCCDGCEQQHVDETMEAEPCRCGHADCAR